MSSYNPRGFLRPRDGRGGGLGIFGGRGLGRNDGPCLFGGPGFSRGAGRGRGRGRY
jgi:hypothetical protein